MTFDSTADNGRTAKPEEYLGYSRETLQLVLERSALRRSLRSRSQRNDEPLGCER
jgi:hypothetical protein